jgi:hypothetical protein
MFRYRLHSPDGEDLGEATYAMMITLACPLGDGFAPRRQSCPLSSTKVAPPASLFFEL